jgi:hypothetical protein
VKTDRDLWQELLAKFSGHGLHWTDLKKIDNKWRQLGHRAKDPAGLIGLKY